MGLREKSGRTYVLGVDLGLTMTGLCLLDSSGSIVDAAAVSASKSGTDISRIDSVSEDLWFLIEKMCGFQDTLFAIEYPILRGSGRHRAVTTYRKQIHLLTRFIRDVVEESGHVVEINPTASKLAATGNGAASKQEIIDAGPFAKEKLPRAVLEAVSDAWAHAISARLGVGAEGYVDQIVYEPSKLH